MVCTDAAAATGADAAAVAVIVNASASAVATACTVAKAGASGIAVANAGTNTKTGASGIAVANAGTNAKAGASADAAAHVSVAVDTDAPAGTQTGETLTKTAPRGQPHARQAHLPAEKWHPPSLHSGNTSQLLASPTATPGLGCGPCDHWKQQLEHIRGSRLKVRCKQRRTVGRLAIVCHNACSLSSLKLQHSRNLLLQYDRTAAAILCFQETWLSQFDSSSGDKAVHVARTKQQGGGILTLVPASVPLQA